ncbi:MAG: thiol reductant ABC exporter subunit CydC [Actinobacteria bacterium 69-20]|nr:thiol reductant ABC exporter subunit CydC [Actinomycetota bacterium]OJV27180.1 MAG: thiol reductant ABC exporter subunit CydC [Actinobacteria bacterium 69-20]
MRGAWRPSGGVVRSGIVGGLAAACGIALTATAGWLIVSAAARPQILTLMVAIVGVRAFGIARPGLRYAQRIASHNTALADLTSRRARLFAALIPLTPARLGRRRRSEMLTSIVSDLDDEVDAQVRVTVPMIATGVGCAVAAGVAGLLLPTAGLAIAGLLVVVAAVGAVDWWIQTRAQSAVLAGRAAVAESALLAAQHADELRAIGAGPAILARLAADHRALRGAVRRQAAGRAIDTALTTVAVAAATVAVAVIAFAAARHGAVTAPVAALLVVTPIALGEVLVAVPDAMTSLARSTAARHRVRRLLSQPPAVAQAAVPDALTVPGPEAATVTTPEAQAAAAATSHARQPAPTLELIDLTASWGVPDAGSDAHPGAGNRPDLGPVRLRLDPGERVMIIGPSGCGKTTLLSVLARGLDPSAGSYTIDGTSALDLDLEQVRAHFAILHDEPHVFATSLRQNLLLARPDATDAHLHRAIRDAGLAPWFAQLPEGLDTMIGADHRDLSGGERARLGLARAVLSERPVLLLDEPVAHLDHPTAIAVLADVVAACPDRTIVMVSHRDDAATVCDRVIDLGHRP